MLMTFDSILRRINLVRPSKNMDRISFTSFFNLAISYTFLSALCELAIMIIDKAEIKRMNLQFLNESSLTKNVPFNMLYIRFFIYNFSAILSFALLALLLTLISSSEGTISPFTFFSGTSKFPNISRSGSPSNMPFLIKRFTNRSSKE